MAMGHPRAGGVSPGPGAAAAVRGSAGRRPPGVAPAEFGAAPAAAEGFRPGTRGGGDGVMGGGWAMVGPWVGGWWVLVGPGGEEFGG